MKIQRLFSTELPKDWDSDDDDYINMVENAKERNKKLAKASKYLPLGFGLGVGLSGGALTGNLATGGGLKGTVIGGLAGAGIGVGSTILGKKLVDSSYGTNIRNLDIKKMSKRDQRIAEEAINKYKKMKTKEERLDYRKRIGSRV